MQISGRVDFIGIGSIKSGSTSAHRYPELGERTRNKVKKYYIEDIKNLEGLIGRDLSSWR